MSQNSLQPDDPQNDFPSYANDENKGLNKEIIEKKEFVYRFTEEIEEINERVKILTDHFKNVQEELVHTQTLVDTEVKEIESEDHLKQLSERQIGRLYSDLQKLEQEAAEQQDRLNSIQNQIFKGNEKLDQYKLKMNWNQEELEQWALASRQKEDDNLTLEKYRRADEAKIKELTLHIEKLTMDVRQKQEELDREVTETQAKQIELDKTAEEFKRMHAERHELYERLQDTVKACQRLDKSLHDAGETFGNDRFRIRKKQETLSQRIKNLQKVQIDNQQAQGENTLYLRQLEAQRLKEIQTEQDLKSFKAEVDITKNQLSALASDLAGKRAQIIALNKELAEIKQRFEESKKKEMQTRLKLRSECAMTDNLEAKAKAEELEYKVNQDIQEGLEQEIRDAKERLFKETQTLLDLRSVEANLLGEIKGALAAGRNLQAAISKRDQEIQRQHVLLYNADYLIQFMQRKVDEAKGVQVTDKNKDLLIKCDEKEAELKEKEEQLDKVSKSVKELTDDLRLIERTIEKTQKEESVLSNNYQEMTLQIKMIELEIEKEQKRKDEVLVQHDTMKLEVKKLKDILCGEADRLFSVENRKQQLKMSMEEREKEINVHKETLLAEQRAAEDEKHKVLVELADRKSKVQNLKVKYENLCYKNRAQEEGEERTQAYYVIKAAQEREELQRYGDELDSKIRKAEREIRALANTLEHLKGRNSKFRDSFAAKGDESEQQMKNALEDQCRGATEQLSKRERELRTLQKQYEEDMKRLMEIQTRNDTLKRMAAETENNKEQLGSQISVQQEKLERAINLARNKETSLDRAQELDLRLQLAKTKNRCLMSTLTILSTDIPEISHLIESALEQHGIKIPSRPPSSAGSRSSRASSRGSRR
ncbi:unnamed protein product [Blepharisma stoltei]|uniref:Coiled-coil domain-containing protein 39 n=1 Tax=Blepharisma stoltei TaxID=1481888 RepID=A0AAU9J676_9CILI|nr:unnamed protein product [Blepharisma stoltei]